MTAEAKDNDKGSGSCLLAPSWSEENLRQAQAFLDSLLTRAPIGFAYLDRNLHFLSINERLAELNGFPASEHIGKHVREIVPSLADTIEAVVAQILATGQGIKDHEFGGQTAAAPGVQRYWNESWYPVHNSCGEVIGFGVIVEEITERKRTEEQLRRNQETFYNLIQNNPFGIYVVDADFRLRQVSLGSQKVFSNVRPLLGRDFAEVLRIVWAEPFATEAIKLFRHTLETGEPYVSVSTLERRNDIATVEAYDWRIERITLPDGRYGVVCYFYDLSERKRWEAALSKSEERFRAFVTATSDIIYSMSPDWTELRRLDGRGLIPTTERPLVGWLEQYIPESDRAHVAAAIREAIQGRRNYEVEHRVNRVDGTVGWVFSRAVPLFDEKGEILEWFGAAREITKRKEAEAALARAQVELKEHAVALEGTVAHRTAELQTALGELESYSYSIAHDMRAPLRGMQGFSKLLLEEHAENLGPEGLHYLERIATSAERLDRLIRDVLSYSKIVNGSLQMEAVEPRPLVVEIIESYPHLHQVRSNISVVGAFPAVWANRAALTQVFSNLLGNAVKFVPEGVEPSISVRTEAVGDRIRFWVEDNGIGIESQAKERIFQLFQRLNRPELYEGTGLGLAIVRKAVERMGGAVGVESQPGQGSRFWFELKPVRNE